MHHQALGWKTRCTSRSKAPASTKGPLPLLNLESFEKWDVKYSLKQFMILNNWHSGYIDLCNISLIIYVLSNLRSGLKCQSSLWVLKYSTIPGKYKSPVETTNIQDVRRKPKLEKARGFFTKAYFLHTWYLSFFLHICNLWLNFSPHKVCKSQQNRFRDKTT